MITMNFYLITYRLKGNKDTTLREQVITAHTLQSTKEIFNGTINRERKFTIVKAKKNKVKKG